MKVCLIQPPGLMPADNYTLLPPLPLAVGYLAASARRAGHDVSIVDAVGSAIDRVRPWATRPDQWLQGLAPREIIGRVPADAEVIGVSSMFTNSWPMVREIVAGLRQAFPDALLVLGGENATSVPEMALRQTGADLCVLGEGEATFLDILERRAAGGTLEDVPGTARLDDEGLLRKGPERARIADVDSLPWPAWDLLETENYLSAEMFIGPGRGVRSIPMLATRGCPFRCTFCASELAWKPIWKARAPHLVVDEMEHYVRAYGANDFQFQDLTAILRKDWIAAFCRELIRRGLRVSWSLPLGTRSEAIDAETARLLKASGCHHITFAPESGSEETLKEIDKRVDLERLAKAARVCLDAGLFVNLFHVIGFPKETAADRSKTFAWIRRMARAGVHEVTVTPFTAIPGTRLFEDLRAEGRIRLDDEFCYSLAMTSLLRVRSWNSGLSSGELAALRIWGLAQFYLVSFATHPSRVWSLLRNVASGRVQTKTDRAAKALLRGLVERRVATPAA